MAEFETWHGVERRHFTTPQIAMIELALLYERSHGHLGLPMSALLVESILAEARRKRNDEPAVAEPVKRKGK